MNRILFSFPLLLCFAFVVLISCDEETKALPEEVESPVVVVDPDMRYGYDFNQYDHKQLKIKRGDSLGAILERNRID